MSDDQMTYMLKGDLRPRRGPAHLQHRKAFKVQGGRVLPDNPPVKLQPVEAVTDEQEVTYALPEKDFAQPKNKGGRPRKTEPDADQA